MTHSNAVPANAIPEPKFGTSGLRGLALGFTSQICHAYVAGFLTHLQANGYEGKLLCLGIDRRASSEAIAARCQRAAESAGFDVIYAGLVPTPALACFAAQKQCPAIMVTGSHNPENQNGLKFYRHDGELNKSDEAPIREYAEQARAKGDGDTHSSTDDLPKANPEVAQMYARRYTDLFPGDHLSGLRVGVDQHSAVGRDLMVEILEALGATTLPLRRSETFLAVDTEAIDKPYLDMARGWLDELKLDAIVSTDGDGDRPLVIANDGTQISGEILGVLAADYLGFSTIVSPVSSSTALESCDRFSNVIRTRIGSPYVIAAMEASFAEQANPIAGFEANGGFLSIGELQWHGKVLPELLTRDAMLPMICVLGAAKEKQCSLSDLIGELPKRIKLSGRLKNYPPKLSASLIAELVQSKDMRGQFLPALAEVGDINTIDGARFEIVGGDIVHFRPSGNADELRCYVETGDEANARTLLAAALEAAENRRSG